MGVVESGQLRAERSGFGIPVEPGEADGFWWQESGFPHGILHLVQVGSQNHRADVGPVITQLG